MKHDQVAASGQCLLPVVDTDADAQKILDAYKIKAPKALPEERIALARGLFQVSALYGGIFKPMENVTVSFSDGGGKSSQNGFSGGTNHIDMRRSDSCGWHPNNVAHMMHEFCHQVGNYNGASYYSSYARAVGGSCHPTGYSGSNSHENFAEVCSAYITRPEKLLKGDKGCQKAYAYFSEQVFKKNGSLASCNTKTKDQLLNQISLDTNQPNKVASALASDFGARPTEVATATETGTGGYIPPAAVLPDPPPPVTAAAGTGVREVYGFLSGPGR
jgi:hypothetical protein